MTGLARRLLIVFNIVGLLAGAMARGAYAQASDEDDYLALIEAYEHGETRAAAQALSERDDRWVAAVLASTEKRVAEWTPDRVRAAALLHTETVVGGWVLPSHVALHLGAARRYVNGRRGNPLPPEFQRGWLLTVCWHFQSGLEFGALVPWLDELRERFPDWSETALATGVFYEGIGWTSSMPGDLSSASRSRLLTAMAHGGRQDALELAVAALRRVTTDPTVGVQASIRLGRVLGELGRADEARTVLSTMVRSAPERRWRYLASLFLASTEARAGRADAERAAYEEAARMMPGCQTALVGLTAVHRRQGNTALAVESAEALTLDTRGCDDPWWFYRFGQPPDRLPDLLESLRGAAR